MSHQVPCPLQSIDSAIQTINGLKTYLDNAFISLQNKTQEDIDRIIETEINTTINANLAKMRNSLLSCLQEQYKQFQDMSAGASSLNLELSADISKILAFCQAVKDWFIKAYSSLMTFIPLLTSHLIDLTNAITDIVAYTPPVTGISFSKLNIQCEPITMQDITGES